MSWLKLKVLKITQEWSPKRHLVMKIMPSFDVCGTVFKELVKDIDVLDVHAKTETAASSKNSGWKSTENEQNKRKRSIVILEDICTGVSQWCKSLMMTVKVEFSINTVELEVKYLYNHLTAAAICMRRSANQFSATTSVSLEPITGRKSETVIPQNIDGSRIGKTIRSRYYPK